MAVSFGPHITIDGGGTRSGWNGPRYERVVARLLHDILHSDTGRAILAEITRSLTICPNPGDVANARPHNQTAATRRGQMVRGCRNGIGLRSAAGELLYGAGIGSNVTIEFTPADYGPPSPTNMLPPDTVLVHELSHAVRQMAGILDCYYMGDDFLTIEEFFAILVGNIFQSELRRTALTPNHSPAGPMARESDYMRGRGRVGLVDRMAREQPRFTRRLAQVRGATFNPFLDYY